MEKILNVMRVLDSFGVVYNFRYRDKKKYKTALGGFFLILFLVLVFVLGILSFIPFVNRKNYTIVYYTMNLAETENVELYRSESNFAVGLSCDVKDYQKKDIFKFLELKSNFVKYQKFNDGSYKKFPKDVITHKCTYDDFYNKYNGEFDYLGLSDYECIDDKDDSIQGIYADEIFSYFEFSVSAKNKSAELLDEIENYLMYNDCKLNFAYTDIIIDLDNYKSPITQYINQVFIQLNPSLFIKRNIYFMNQYFTTDDYLMYVYGDITPKIMPLYSRYEEYSLYIGLNRKETQPPRYDYFSKIYLRADLKKTIIKRKYQRLMEFYASTSCLLNAIYKILVLILNYINNLYGFHSISKFIFFFKELDDENNFNISKKSNMIKEVLSIMNYKNENLDNDMNSNISEMIKNVPPKKKIMVRQRLAKFKTEKEGDAEDIKDEKDKNLYNTNKKQTEFRNYRNPPSVKTLTFLTRETLESKEDISKKDNNYDVNNNYIQGNLQRYKLDQKKKKNNSRLRVNFKYNKDNNIYSSEKIGTNSENDSNHSNKNINGNNQIKNSFDVFELLISQAFRCCLPNNMSIKSNAVNKAKKIIFKKLDVITYIRNTILFDKINEININNKEKALMNFISRPIISVCNKDEKNEFAEFYENYEDKSFDKYYEEITELVNKNKKEEKDYKLLSISSEHLKAFS